jgi:hypothetical protein
MNHPKVYDAKGRVLEVGSRVEDGEREWTVDRIEWVGRLGWRVLAVATDRPHKHLPFYTQWFGSSPADEPNTFRCPDLLLITDEEKGPASG